MKRSTNMRLVGASILATLLSSCASSTGVIPIGRDTYSVSHESRSIAASIGDVKALAYRDAAAFCAGQGKGFEVTGGTDVPRSLGQFPQTEVQFRCIAK